MKEKKLFKTCFDINYFFLCRAKTSVALFITFFKTGNIVKEAIKARVIDVKSRGNPITVMQFLKSSNGTHLIVHPRDHAPIT